MPSTKEENTVLVTVVSGPEGKCLVINDYRVAGPKPPWGGGRVVGMFKVRREDIERAFAHGTANG